ncbi:hypothetical protein JCM8097_001535 [Rhodosporidiobolus ruineniae]
MSTASPPAQVDDTLSTTTADQLATSADTTLPPSSSPNSPNPGAKPARPPKAAKRPSTANARERKESAGSASAGSSAVNVAGEGNGIAGETDATTASSTEAAPVQGDATAASLAGASTALPGAPPVAEPVSANGAAAQEEPKRSSTASQPASEQTGESSTSKVATSTASPAETTASAPVSKTAPAPSATAPPPDASTSAKPAAAPAPTPKAPSSTKKRKGGAFSFLFACIPCVSSPGHDDTPANSGLPKRPSTAARILDKEKEKQPSSSASGSGASKGGEEKKALVPVEPESALTPPTQEPLLAASPDTPAGPPPPTASPSQHGVQLSQEETEGVTSGAVVPPGQSGPPTPAPGKTKRKRSGKHRAAASGTDGIITSVPEPGAPRGGIVLAGAETSSEDGSSEEGSTDDDEDEEDEEDEEQSLIARGGVGIPIGEDGLPRPLLEELSEDLKGRKCLVLDLDETLVHSSFKMVHQADYVVPVEIENQFHNVYVIKRPGVDGFLKAMGEIYEVVVFTASLSKYADPVLDQLDVHRVVKHRLFRESCYNNKGNYVKDLSQLGRPMEECIIIDNSPASYVFHPNNAVPISSWFNDPHDTELTDLVPFLTDLGTVDDVRAVLDANLYQQLAPVPGGGGVAGTGFVQA